MNNTPEGERDHPTPLLNALQQQMRTRLSGGIYHRVQVDLTYNSNHIEGSRLTHDQTRLIFDTHTLATNGDTLPVDDIIETANHFRCIDHIIANARQPLTQALIKHLHAILKQGTQQAQHAWFAVGKYKELPNEVGGQDTTPPSEVAAQMTQLIKDYAPRRPHTLQDLLDFHVRFERIHPFQDGNGRVGRLILFKECLREGIVPFIITDTLKPFYLRGIQHWPDTPGYLTDTCLTAQDQFAQRLDYFQIPH